MNIDSMTGFAREAGEISGTRFAWEIKAVNGKAFDVRLRVPAGFEELGEEARKRIAAAAKRGTIFINLSLTRPEKPASVRINEGLLDTLVALCAKHAGRDGLAPPSLDGLLAVRGVVEVVETQEDEAEAQALRKELLASFEKAVTAFAATRRSEGQALVQVLNQRLDAIEVLAKSADASPARKPEAIAARLATQVEALLGTGQNLDPNRLHQEAVLLATKADIREEIDRLHAHVAAVRELLGAGGAVGRRLDFLAQELSREANTLSAKAGDIALTAIGLELKTLVEQFREQVQNIE